MRVLIGRIQLNAAQDYTPIQPLLVCAMLSLGTAMMKYLAAVIRGIHSGVGISLPKPEQEKAVVVVWLVAAVVLVLVILGTGWLVLSSMSSSVT